MDEVHESDNLPTINAPAISMTRPAETTMLALSVGSHTTLVRNSMKKLLINVYIAASPVEQIP